MPDSVTATLPSTPPMVLRALSAVCTWKAVLPTGSGAVLLPLKLSVNVPLVPVTVTVCVGGDWSWSWAPSFTSVVLLLRACEFWIWSAPWLTSVVETAVAVPPPELPNGACVPV